MSSTAGATSYGKQLSDSIGKFLFGLVLITLTTIAMWMIEQQAVKFAMILGRCQTACRIIKDIVTVNRNYNNRCILVKGTTSVRDDFEKTNADPETGFVADSKTHGNLVRLRRTVEMYQWVEKKHTEKKKGQPDRVTYTYKLEWSSFYHDSSKFHDTGSKSTGNSHSDRAHVKHTNPPMIPNLDSKTQNAEAFVGGYKLSDAQVSMLADFKQVELSSCPFSEKDLKVLGARTSSLQTTASNESYIVYKSPELHSPACSLDEPEVGLVRVSYAAIYENGKITTVGVLTRRGSFRPFREKDAHATFAKGGLRALCCGSKQAVTDKRAAAQTDIESPVVTKTHGHGSDDLGNDDDDNEQPSTRTSTACCDACGWLCPCCKIVSLLLPCMGQCIHSIVGEEVLLVEEKHSSLPDMFQHANDAFHYRLRISRVVCVLMFWASVSLIFSPVSTILGFVPLIGGLASGLLGLLTFILAMVLAGLVFAVAWTAFHPEYLAVLMLAVGLPCWLSTTVAAGWAIFGGICTIGSVIPIGFFIANWVEECRFASEQDRLDEEIASHANSGSGAGLLFESGTSSESRQLLN
jgi:hypothetical protein